MKRVWILIVVLMITWTATAQKGYKIQVKIKGYQDTSLLLASYYGNKIRLVNTAFTKEPGDFVFGGKKALPGGVYIVVSPKKVKLFEFLINKNQHFNLQTDTANIDLHLKALGSTENSVFFNYLQYSDKIYKEVLALRKELKQTEKNTLAYKHLQENIATLRKQNITKRTKLIQSHPGTFVAKLFEAMEEVRVPKNTHPADSLYALHYLQKHFWDHFDLSDPRLLRSPMYDQKLKAYFKQLVPFQPDSVDRAIDKVIAMARPSKECVSYLVWYFTVEYQNPKYMGFDKVFVHMVDQYFSKEPIENTTASIKRLLEKRAAEIRPLLIGNRAPELILQDTAGKFVSFYSIRKKLTLLFFWDYKCHICKRQLAELVPMYPELAKRYDLAIYAININPDLDNWKAAVRNRHLPWINVNGTRSVKGDFTKLYDIHGTPQLFLLNQNKEIIAKQFSVDQLKMILSDYMKRH